MTTPIEVIDTAVKIGLGALISGVATYWVTHSKNKLELRKLTLQDKRSTLREIAITIEESTDLLNDFAHLSYDDNEETIANNMKSKKQLLIDSHKKAYRAEALANLVGYSELSSAIYAFDKAIQDLHSLIASDIAQFDIDRGNELIRPVNEQQKVIKSLISQAYLKLCA